MTAVHTWQWLKTKLHTLSSICEQLCKSSNNYNLIFGFFFKVPQRWSCTDREQKWYTFQVCLQLMFMMLHVIVNFLLNLFFLSEYQHNCLKPYLSFTCSPVCCCVFDSPLTSSISFSSVHCKALILLQNILQQLSEIVCVSKKCLDLYNFTMLQP